MASRTDFEGSTDVGVFATLTNAYCITGLGASANFYRCAGGGWAGHASACMPCVRSLSALHGLGSAYGA